MLYVRRLSFQDLDAIMAQEQASFSPSMQATKETEWARLQKGHVFFGITAGERAEKEASPLQGMISFSDACFDPEHWERFPLTFKDFSSQQMPKDPNAIFVYNLSVRPEARGRSVMKDLIDAAFAYA